MTSSKKNRFKPLFKQLIKLRENVQNRQKLLRFKKEKWKTFLKFYINKNRSYRKFKPVDSEKYVVTKYGTRGTGYTKRYRDTLQAGKRLRVFYGGLLKKYFKNRIRKVLNKTRLKVTTDLKLILLKSFESRLDVVLYRAKFAASIKSARQLILHKKIYVNDKKVKNKAYMLNPGDTITLNPKCLEIYENNIIQSLKWPLPPKYLVINYKTMQILFLGSIEDTNLSNNFSFNLKLEKILINYIKQ